MNVDDVVVLEGDGEGRFGEHYLIGRLRQRDAPYPAETPLWLDVVDNDQDRTTAFDKARKAAAGHDVFFTQRGRPGHLHAQYNSSACPKCGMYTRAFQEPALANGAQRMRCHACQHTIEMTIKEP
jgi:hypothetical protein